MSLAALRETTPMDVILTWLGRVAKTGRLETLIGPYGTQKPLLCPAVYEVRWSHSRCSLVWVPTLVYPRHRANADGIELILRRLAEALELPWTLNVWPGKDYGIASLEEDRHLSLPDLFHQGWPKRMPPPETVLRDNLIKVLENPRA